MTLQTTPISLWSWLTLMLTTPSLTDTLIMSPGQISLQWMTGITTMTCLELHPVTGDVESTGSRH